MKTFDVTLHQTLNVCHLLKVAPSVALVFEVVVQNNREASMCCDFSGDSCWTYDRPIKRCKWEGQARGWWRQIGEVAGRPICVSVGFARVAFVDGCSELVDWKMIREWIKSEAQPHAPIVDAMNFHNALR